MKAGSVPYFFLNRRSMALFGYGFLAFTSLCGIAAQGVGLHFSGLFLSLLCLRQTSESPFSGRPELFKIGWALLGLYWIFPVWNALALFFPTPDIPALAGHVQRTHTKFQFLYRSQMSVAFANCGLWALAVGLHLKNHFWTFNETKTVWKVFQKALFCFSSMLLVYLIAQHYTGFRIGAENLQANKLLSDGTYRVIGFYGHPLSLSSVSLGLFVFFLISATKSHERYAYAISAIHFVCLILSGGRTSIAIGGLALLGILAVLTGKKLIRPKIFLAGGTFLVTLSFVFWGNLLRFRELFSSGVFFEDRVHFWKIYMQMIQDRLLFGHGSFWLQTYREDYYQALGLGDSLKHYNAHNIFLELLASLGLVGTTLFFALLWILLRASRRLADPANLSTMWLAFWMSFAANLLHGFSQNTLFDSNYLHVFLMFLIMMITLCLDQSRIPQKKP